MRESSIERLVGARGATEKEKEDFVQGMGRDIFEEAKHLEVFGEVPKTPEQRDLCTRIDTLVREVALKYGGRDLVITPDHVRITDDPTQVVEAGDGQFQPERQLVIERTPDNDLDFAYKTTHEFLHFKSHGAMQIPLDEEMSPDMYYRVGLRLNNRTGTKTYFNALEEGMNEELTKRLIVEFRKTDSSLARIAAETDVEVGRRSLDESLVDDLIYLDEKGDGKRFTYIKERESAGLLIDKILKKHPEEFQNQEQVFDIFARAKFSGNILPLARLIDTTFGTGTFRKIGEAYKGDELKAVVETL